VGCQWGVGFGWNGDGAGDAPRGWGIEWKEVSGCADWVCSIGYGDMQGRGIYPDGLASRFMGDIFEVKGDISEIRAGFLFYGRNPGFKGELEIFQQGHGGVSRDIPQQVFNLFYERNLWIYARNSRYMREKFILCAKYEIYARTVDYPTNFDTANLSNTRTADTKLILLQLQSLMISRNH
jgi:hypothetical protein